MLEKYKQQLNDLDKIAPTIMLGIFHLKLSLLKNVAKPTCEKLLELVERTMIKYGLYIKMYILSIIFKVFSNRKSRVGKQLVNEVLSEINNSLKYLHTSPSTAAQYVDYKKFLEKCSKRVSN